MDQADGSVARGCVRREASVCEQGRVQRASRAEVAFERAVECLQVGSKVGDPLRPVGRCGRPGALRRAGSMWVGGSAGEKGCGGPGPVMVSEQ